MLKYPCVLVLIIMRIIYDKLSTENGMIHLIAENKRIVAIMTITEFNTRNRIYDDCREPAVFDNN